MSAGEKGFPEGMHGYYTAEGLPERWREAFESLPDYHKQLTVPDFLSGRCWLVYKAETGESYKGEVYCSIDHSVLALISPAGRMCRLYKSWRNDRYEVFPIWEDLMSYKEVSNYKQEEIRKELKRPNRVGSWSEKKLADWLNYCDEYVEAMERAKDYVSQARDANLQRITDFIESVPGCEVTRRDDKTWIDIPDQGFYLTFTLEKGESYMREDITYRGSLEDLQKLLTK